MFRTFTCPSSGVLIYRLFHCRMWCHEIGVEAVVLRSRCVVLCTVYQLVSNKLEASDAFPAHKCYVKCTVVPRQAEVAQGVPASLRLRIILTFRHYKGGRSLAKTPAAFTPGEIPGTHFQRLSGPQGTWFCRGYHGKNPQ